MGSVRAKDLDRDVRLVADPPAASEPLVLGTEHEPSSADPSGRLRALEANLEALRVTVARLEAEVRGLRWQVIDAQDPLRGR